MAKSKNAHPKKEKSKSTKPTSAKKTEPKKVEKKKKNTGKILAVVIPVAIVLLGAVLILILNLNKPVPYVVAKEIEVVSAKETYQNRVTTYTTDLNGEVIDVGSKFEESYATYNFYDYSVSEPDENGYEITSFKIDTVVPIKFTRTDLSYKNKYYYTYSIIWPLMFDYYTGGEYQKNTTRSDKEANDEDKDFKYNDVTWDGKTYKIGVRSETDYKWDGKQKIGNDTYTDTSKSTTTFYVSAPKGYDGLMIAILKEGSTQESFDGNRNWNKKYDELKKQADETGEKSEEYLKMESIRNGMNELLQSRYDENKRYVGNDFYVFWVNDIKPVE